MITPNSTAVATAPPNSGQNSIAPWVGSTLRSSSAELARPIRPTEAAAAHIAIRIAATGIVLASFSTGISGSSTWYWWTSRATIRPTPTSIGISTIGAPNACAVSSEAPKKAAAVPNPARVSETTSIGASGSCASASS